MLLNCRRPAGAADGVIRGGSVLQLQENTVSAVRSNPLHTEDHLYDKAHTRNQDLETKVMALQTHGKPSEVA